MTSIIIFVTSVTFYVTFSLPQVSKSDAPGENGKAHHLRVEQKIEEENLKGVYGFNQVLTECVEIYLI